MSPIKTRLCLDGAVPTRAFLYRTYSVMRDPGHCRSDRLCKQLTYLPEHTYPPAFVKGFTDTVDAYPSMSFGGNDVGLHMWEVLTVIERW